MNGRAVALTQIASTDALMAAWKKVRANRGAAGLDGVTIQRFEQGLESNLKNLSALLREGQYLPMPPRRVLIPKKGGDFRPLGILSVEDRIVQRAVLDALEPACEAEFLVSSFGYRPGRSIRDAAKAVLSHRAAGCDWVLDADIEDFFGSLDHGRVLDYLGEVVADPAVFNLLRMCLGDTSASQNGSRLRAGGIAVIRRAHRLSKILQDRIGACRAHLPSLPEDSSLRAPAEDLVLGMLEEGLRRVLANPERLGGTGALRKILGVCGAAALAWSAFPALASLLGRQSHGVGVLQGAPISPLLANLYLHRFDLEMVQAGHRLVRYADDFVVLCRSREEAGATLHDVEEALGSIGLRLNREKTGIANFEEGFEFLGYTFRGDTAQMGDDSETRIRVPLIREAMRGLRRTVRNVSSRPIFTGFRARRIARLLRTGRRAFARRNAPDIPIEEEKDDVDALR